MAAFYPNFTRPLQLSLSKQREKKHDIDNEVESDRNEKVLRPTPYLNLILTSQQPVTQCSITTTSESVDGSRLKTILSQDTVTSSLSVQENTIHNKNCTHACERKPSETNTTHKVTMIQCSLISKFIAEDCDLTSTQNMAMAQWTTRDFGRCQDM